MATNHFSPSTKTVRGLVESGKKVRLYIKLASPKFGKFVALKDCEELLEKRMVRFVMDSNAELFDNAHDAVKLDYTKVLTISSIESIKSFGDE